MSESSDHPITVTAQKRAHPALQKLARACIALARQLREPGGPEPATLDTTSGKADRGRGHA